MGKMASPRRSKTKKSANACARSLTASSRPKDCGFIIRTAGIGKSKLEIERDLKYLARLWETLKKKIDKEKPPVELYTERRPRHPHVRDVFTSDVDHITIDDKETPRRSRTSSSSQCRRSKNKV
jgi:ribonuclease E